MAEHIINFVEGDGIAIQSSLDVDQEAWNVEISGILAGLLEAKGDLVTAADADTPARLPAGADGQVLTADSAADTGLAWADSTGGGGGGAPSGPAGGVLSGTYPNPGFAADMATQAELDAVAATVPAGGPFVQLSLLDAKGDLYVASANDTAARLAAGSNGQVLTADSTQTTGLKWATPSAGTLDSLTDVNVPSPADGRVLTYDAGGAGWVAKGGGINVSWAGRVPASTGPDGPVWRVPSKAGASRTFQILKAVLRIETAASGAVTVAVEKSTAGGAFSGTGILFLTIPAGSYEVTDTVTVPFVATGDLLRINWSAVDSATGQYSVQLDGIET